MKKLVVTLIWMVTISSVWADFPYSTNMLVNPGFEDATLPPWTLAGATSMSISNDAHSGVQAVLVTAASNKGIAQNIDITAADQLKKYRFSFWFKCIDTMPQGLIEGLIYEKNSAGTIVATQRGWGLPNGHPALTGSWQQYKVDLTLTNTTTTQINWCIRLRDLPVASVQILIDDAVCYKIGPEPTPYTIFSEAIFTATPPAGWTFYWNAPDNWSPGVTGDLSTGAVTKFLSWRELTWSGSQWTADGNDSSDNLPSDSLKLNGSASHPGSAGNTKCLDRYVIASYEAGVSGDYQVGMAWIEDLDASGNGLLLKVLLDEMVIKTVAVLPGEVTRFESRLENVEAGDRISVAVGCNGDAANDSFAMDFRIALVTPTFDRMPVFHIADFGAVGDGVTDDIQAFTNAVATANENGGGIINFDGSRSYRIIGNPTIVEAAFNLDGVNNIKLNGNGATLLLHPPHRLADILDCRNIEICGFTVDYDPLPYFQGNIVSVDVPNITIDIQVPDRYDVPDIAGSWPGFSRFFAPDAPGSRSGSGYHIYLDTVTALDTTGRYLRIHARDDMAGAVQFAHDSATEVIMPNRQYAQWGNYSLRIRCSLRVAVNNVEFHCVPQFVNQCQDNYGPISLSNVDILMKEPETELFVSWRDGFHLKENRFGVLIEVGDWDSAAMYDDLFNMSTHMGNVQAIPAVDTYTLFLEGGDYHTWKVGDWVSIWDANQDVKRGMARITSPDRTTGVTFTITLDRTVSGVVAGDIFVNEEMLNRDTLVRHCSNRNIGAKGASARLRTPALFYDNNFIDSYWWLYTESTREGPRPREIIFKDCELEGKSVWGLAVISSAFSAAFDSCIFDGHKIVVRSQSENVKFTGSKWINLPDKAVVLEDSGPLYVWNNRVFDTSGQEADFLSKISLTEGSTSEDIIDLTASMRQSCDLNNDLIVNLPDLSHIASEWECHYTLKDLVTFAYIWLDDWGPRLIGHWKLDETAGTTASDSSGKTMHGTL